MTHFNGRIERISDATLYLGDCQEVLPTLSGAGSVITDPPYGIGFKYESHDDDPATYPQFIWSIMESAEKLIPPGGAVFVWQAQLRIRDFALFFPRDWRLFVAAKNFVQIRPHAMNYAYDPVVVWWKEGATPWKADKAVKAVNRDWFISDTASAISDVKSLARLHPGPRQTDVMEYIVNNWCDPAGIVLDPFMGSGTTGVACAKLGRGFIGIEKDAKYFDIACRRIEQAYRQRDLFIAAPVLQSSEDWSAVDLFARSGK